MTFDDSKVTIRDAEPGFTHKPISRAPSTMPLSTLCATCRCGCRSRRLLSHALPGRARAGPAAILGPVFGFSICGHRLATRLCVRSLAGSRQLRSRCRCRRLAGDAPRDDTMSRRVNHACKTLERDITFVAFALVVQLQFEDATAKSRPGGSATASSRSGGGFSRQGAASGGSFSGAAASAQNHAATAQGGAASAQQFLQTPKGHIAARLRISNRQRSSSNNQQFRRSRSIRMRKPTRTHTTWAEAFTTSRTAASSLRWLLLRDNDDEAAALVTGLVVGAAVGSAAASYKQQSAAPAPAPTTTVVNTAPLPAAPPPLGASLPCNPNVVKKNGVTYNQCGQTYCIQAYGSGGPIHMPVPPP